MHYPILHRTLALLILAVFLFGCADQQDLARVEAAIEDTRISHAPDKRVAWFKVEAGKDAGKLILTGKTNLPEARQQLADELARQGLQVEDRITLLPEADLGEQNLGLVTLSVANIRSAPRHAAELATQALLGTPLNVLKKEGGFYLVQTPDQYIGWLDWGGLQRVTREEMEQYAQAEKVLYLETSGFSYQRADAGSQRVSDLISGNLLVINGEEGAFYRVVYPDGRTAYVRKTEALLYNQWLADLNVNGPSLASVAQELMGAPYLWGGTSTKGMDCSGFTKTVYFMNGIILPRDASQQVHTGLLIDDRSDFSDLETGDLLFFGPAATDSTRERVVHVGMWIGNNEFIHASGQVRVSSMDPEAANFDAYNLNRYLRTKRILTQEAEVQYLQEGGLFAEVPVAPQVLNSTLIP